MRHFAQDYFGKTVGSVKRVMLTYGPSGRSRGIATIIFGKPGSAADAASQLNGVKVDNKAMKVCDGKHLLQRIKHTDNY